MSQHNFTPEFHDNTSSRVYSAGFRETSVVNRGLRTAEIRDGDLIGIYFDGHEENLGSVTAYETAVQNGYTGTEAEWCQDMLDALAASTAASTSQANALKSEGYTVGKQNGTDVDSSSPYYHNNTKYFYEEAADVSQHIDTVAQSIPQDYSTLSGTVSTLAENQPKYVRTVAQDQNNPTKIIVTNGSGSSSEIIMTGGAENLADPFNTLLTYAVDDYVSYNGVLYKCHTAVETAGAWTGDTNWTAVIITDEMGVSELVDVDYDENYYLHFYDKNGEELYGGPFYIQGGGGGGGGSAITLDNVVKVSTVRNGAAAVFSFDATSSDDTDITVEWYVDNVHIVDQGNISGSTFTFNAGPYLRPSAVSTVKAMISSEGGGSLTRQWNVTSTAFSLSWGAAIQPITLYTENENVYVVINVLAQAGTSNTVTVSVGQNEEERTVIGSKSITVELNKTWFEVGANTVTATMVSDEDENDEADPIQYVALWGYGATDPIVAFAYVSMTGVQYDVIDIPYFVYDPDSETAECEIQIGSETPRTIEADRTMRIQQYAPQSYGTFTVTLTCEEETATMSLVVTQSDYNIGKVTGDSLRYDLDPVGHSNQDADRDQFGNLTFSQGFDWVNGGFQTDSNGAAAFVVKKGDRATMPRSLFADSDGNGKVIDVSFRVTNSDQYDTVVMQDLNNSNTKGLILKANEGELRLDNASGQAFKYCEDGRIDLSIHVEDAISQRLVTIWLDGIPSKTDPYEINMLVHTENELVIGSDHCDIWIYAIRCYNAKLSIQEMIQNYISLGSTTEEKVNRCITNNIYDANDNITPASLHAAMPNLTIIEIEAERMTTNKKDNVPADITITDGTTKLVLPAATGPDTKDGAIFKAQGTSSAAYGRSNYNMDIDFKGTGKKYKISDTSIPVNYLNIKVNVASSENANNVNAVDWYNTYQPYKIEADSRPGVRDVVEAKPCAVFFKNTSETAQWFSSQLVQPGDTILYAMGDLCNSKKNLAVFGEDGEGTHPTMACVEVSGNDTEPERFITDQGYQYRSSEGAWQTFNGYDDQGKEKWITHFEWRMEPDENDEATAVAAWEAAVSWVVSTIGNSTKFKNEVSNYFAIDSLLYHFLMIEFMAAYDDVSKNTFYSYDYDEDEEKYLWNIKKAYDWDTILAADNDGKPFGDYGIDYGDTVDGTVGGRSYFNAVDNTIWTNIKAAFQTELSAMYITLRSAGAWNAANFINKWDMYQAKRPHAAMAHDAYNKYVLPYKTTGVVIDGQTLSYDDSYLPRLQGSKTYQRRQFMSYQADYMDGKYGYYNKSAGTQFRTNCASTTEDFTIKAYAKTYITVIVDDNKIGSQKVQAGGTVTFENVSVGTNTTLYFTPDRLIQYIRPLNATQNSTFAASGAAKLMEAILGGETQNTAWLSGTGLNIPSVILKDLSIKNMVNFSSALNLSANVELETLDTRGTNAGAITLPSYAPLESIQLNACTALTALNLHDVETFTMTSGDNLLSVRMENCNSLLMNSILDYLEDAEGLQYLRILNVNWTLEDTTLLNRLLNVGSIDASGLTGNAPCTLTGSIYVPELRTSEKTNYDAAWPDLTITYATLIPQYTVTFLDDDNTPIYDIHGNAYVQYVDAGEDTYDPITAGEVNTPTKASTAQYSYTFDDWDNLPIGVVNNKTVHATYTATTRTYTVTFKDGVPASGGTVIQTLTGQAYGSSVTPPANPTYTADEGHNIYRVFKGWDASTAFITQDTEVHALWIEGNLPDISEGKTLAEMNWAERYAVCKNNLASTYWDLTEPMDFMIGHGDDFEFSNVQSQTLISTPRYFDGTTAPLIFNGQNDLPSIQLFNGSVDRFTLAVDFEFTCDSGALVSCFYDDGNEGFQFRRSGNYTNLLWGSANVNTGYKYQRGMLVLRYNRGQYPLVLYIIYDGNTSNGEYPVNTSQPATNVTMDAQARSIATTTNAPLTFGGVGYYDGTDVTALRGTGWIHWAKIWYDDIGADNAKAIAAMPHIPARFRYTGIQYYDTLESTSVVKAGFQSEGALPLRGRINQTSTNSGGWPASHRRAWLNGQYFAGLPIPLQCLIDEARVKSTEGGGSSSSHSLNIVSGMDKVYLPAYAEAFNVSGSDADSAAYRNEMDASEHRIPSFVYDSSKGQTTDNQTRIKFPGFIIPDDANYVVSNSDPTTPGLGYTVHSEKTVWINSSNSNNGYIYVDADYVAKHKFIDAREPTDSAIISAAGSDSEGHSGGKWYLARTWWLRSPSVANSSYCWGVNTSGSSYNGASGTYGLAPAFSI